MPDYRHIQIGTVTLGVLGAGILIVVAILLARGSDVLILAVLLILVVTAGVFASLTVELRGGVLTFWFGPGLLRKRVQVATIQSCSVVRNPWWYGWGVRWTPRGWLYNVSGRAAVELILIDGRRLRIGTDEPHQLCDAVERARADAVASPGHLTGSSTP
jgi:hypothetical protein